MLPCPADWPRLSSALYYDDPAAAIRFLEEAFGFVTRIRVEGPDGAIEHSELCFGEALVMVAGTRARPGQEPRGASPKSLGGRNTQSLFLYVDDADAHCARARAAGATIRVEPATSDYGPEYWSDRGYEAADPEGHRWWFAHRIRSAPQVSASPEG